MSSIELYHCPKTILKKRLDYLSSLQRAQTWLFILPPTNKVFKNVRGIFVVSYTKHQECRCWKLFGKGQAGQKTLGRWLFEPSVHDLLSHSSQVSAIVLSMKYSLQFWYNWCYSSIYCMLTSQEPSFLTKFELTDASLAGCHTYTML